MSRQAALIVLGVLVTSTSSAQSIGIGTSSAGIYYEARGSGEALVFIHGFSLDRRMWDGQVDVFSSRYRVVRYDLRGHGASVDIDTSYAGYEDLRTVLDALDIRRATLVGLSAGSEIAINFAIAYPERVAGLILASPGLGGYRGPQLRWLQPVLDAAARRDANAAARLWLETPLMTLFGDRNAAPVVSDMVLRNAHLWTATRREQPLMPPAIVRLSSIQSPVLIILGAQDQPHIRDITDVIMRGVDSAALAVIQKAGHLVNIDAPSEFNAAVESFLTAH